MRAVVFEHVPAHAQHALNLTTIDREVGHHDIGRCQSVPGSLQS